MAPPRTRRDQLLRDLAREHSIFADVEGYLRAHLGQEMGGLNVKQNEAILTIIQMIRRIVEGLAETNKNLVAIEEALEVTENTVTLTVGSAIIRMKGDGSIDIRGDDIRVTASGEMTLRSAKNLVLKGQKILQN
jgi:hypothetical protein